MIVGASSTSNSNAQCHDVSKMIILENANGNRTSEKCRWVVDGCAFSARMREVVS
jgi:hypothetical protein